MKILFDINHPAHVHLFKNLIWEMEKKGHEIIVTASHKDIATLLLKKYNIPFIDMGTYGNSLLSKVFNLPFKSLKLAYVAKKKKVDILLGISFRVSHAGWLIGKPSFVFDDTEHASNEIRLYKPFATKIFTPDCFTKDLGKKQVRYPGYHELAYLHPNRFTPNHEVLKEIGLSVNDTFFVLRFVAWDASHDIGHKGISLENKRKLIEILKPHGKIIISSEKKLPAEFEEYRMSICPTKMHDLLYYASLFIGEGATMASECAILGTPAIYVNSLDAGTLQEQNRLGLIYSLRNDATLMEVTTSLLSNNRIDKEEWRANAKEKLKYKIDTTDFILNLLIKQVKMN
ncbi:MAG: DUF354 domain-containing protein [Bacteroidales bacterium]|nr:DUF354 domain-containing protein [Bacteroidales bacterium]